MLKRLLFGLVLGVLVGGLVAAGVVKVFGAVFAGALLAYVAAVVTGVAAGLVAGKPIWQKGASIEAGLKAFFGALLAAGIMFALRRWVDINVDLSAFGAGAGSLGSLPATSLPIVATLLSVFYELDNTDASKEGEEHGKADAPKRIAQSSTRARVADDGESAGEEAEAPLPKKRATK